MPGMLPQLAGWNQCRQAARNGLHGSLQLPMFRDERKVPNATVWVQSEATKSTPCVLG